MEEHADALGAALADARTALEALAAGPGDAGRLAPLQAAHERLAAAVEQQRCRRDRQALLADASSLLLSDLDPDAVLRRLAALAVPDLAEWCTVWLPTGGGAALTGVVTVPESDWRWPDMPVHGPNLTARAFRSHSPLHVDDISALLQQVQPEAALTRAVLAARCGPTYVVPLLSGGVALGCLALTRSRDVAPFSEHDRELARGLAARAASALALAQQHAQHREAARVLQRSLLPDLPAVPGLAVEACYRPAGGIDVGGDWFDLLALADGRVVFVIGDVMGRGVPAAAVMGQVRSAARAYARMQVPPAQVLALLEETVQALDDGFDSPIVTCFLAYYDPAARTATWASAGHVTPFRRRPDGTTTALHGPVGAPLGVGTTAYVESRTALAPGTLLALFTDGLVEDRRRDLGDGLELARGLVAAADPADLPGLARRLLDSVASEEEDDVALLLLCTDPVSA